MPPQQFPARDLLFREWREANRKAHLREQEVAKASLLALEGKGEWPSAEARAEVRQLRELANELLQESMRQIEDRAASNKRP